MGIIDLHFLIYDELVLALAHDVYVGRSCALSANDLAFNVITSLNAVNGFDQLRFSQVLEIGHRPKKVD